MLGTFLSASGEQLLEQQERRHKFLQLARATEDLCGKASPSLLLVLEFAGLALKH